MTISRTIGRWREFRDFVRRHLTWGRLYRTTSYLKSALWTVALVAIVLEQMLAPLLRTLDAWLRWRLGGLALAGATALYQTVITLTLSFLVFTFGSLLVAIQVAGGQLTPRIIATTLLRNNVVRYSVGLFVFTLVFAVGALNRQEAAVSELVSLVTGILGVACIADFLFLIDYGARLLRPVAVVARVGDKGVAMIKSVYPDPATALPPESAALRGQPLMPSREVEHRGKSEIVLAVDRSTRVALAQRHDGMIEFVPQVGDFVAAGEPLFVLHGGAMAVDDRASSSAPQTGNTTSKSPAARFVPAARATFRSRAACARCAKTSAGRCRDTATPCWTPNSACWIGRFKRISAVPRNSRWLALPIRRDWGARRGRVPQLLISKLPPSRCTDSTTHEQQTMPSRRISQSWQHPRYYPVARWAATRSPVKS
jgi:Predicted membrane protein (DUF2254)